MTTQTDYFDFFLDLLLRPTRYKDHM